MKFFLLPLVFVVALPFCFTAPGTISFTTTEIEVKEIDFQPVTLKIHRNGGSDGVISFLCKISNSTDGDFQSYEDNGKFNDKQQSSSCVFYVKDDTKAEGNETFIVKLSLLSENGSVSAPSLSYIKIIANDDAYGVVGFNVPNGITFHEPRNSGAAPKQLPIQRQVGTYGSITVHWKIQPTVDKDVTPTSGTINFQNGEAQKNLKFSVNADNITEEVEEFTFELTSVSGGARINGTLSTAIVKISANDIPLRFALSHVAVPENQSQVIVWIYRGLDSSGTTATRLVDDLISTVSWYLKSGVAMGNHDFRYSNGTVVFGKGETKKSVTITILEDNVPETAENFTVQLASLSPDITPVHPSTCTIQILPSDDHAGVFRLFNNDSITISEDGLNNYARITIKRDAGRFGMVEVSWRATSRISGLSQQILPTNGSVVFGDGEEYQVINISTKQDAVPEEAFLFVVELISVTGGRLTEDPSRRRQEVKVQDSDDVYGAFEFADDSYQKLIITSSDRMAEFVVIRNGGRLRTVVVGYWIKYLLPDGSDHTSSIGIPSYGTIEMVPNQQNASVTFNISQEGFMRANSLFRIFLTSVNLTQPAGMLLSPKSPRLGIRRTLNLTVHEKFADGEIGFEKTSVSVTEPESAEAKEIKVKVFRDGTLNRASLLWSIVNGTTQDVWPTNGSITFEKGVDSANITIQVLPDSLPELDEIFYIRLHNISEPNQRLQPGSSEMVLTILKNDNPGGIFQFDNIKSFVFTETSSNRFSVDVVRLGGDLENRIVKILQINGKDDNDFSPDIKILRFLVGEERKTITFYVKDDDTPEVNETVTFRLLSSGPTGSKSILGNPTEFNVTILANDDPNGIIVFLNTSLSIVESKGDQMASALFFLKRERGLFGDITVFWDVTSRENSASDISPTFGNVTFKQGEQFGTFRIYSLMDNIPELDETFTLQLTEVRGGAKVGNPRKASLTILRNDDAIEFAAPTHVTVTEGNTAELTILRKGRNQEAIFVNYTTIDGSALASDRDYGPINQRVLFDKGEKRKTITVFIPDDNKPESDENFTLALTASTGDTAIYGNTVAIVTIAASDDPNGIFHFDGRSVLNKTVNEGKTVGFRVIRDRGNFGIVSVVWQVYQIFPNGSRLRLTSGDFEKTRGELVFQNGDPWKNLELKLLSDKEAEYGENFEVVLVDVVGGHPGPGGKLSKNLTVAYIRIPTNDHPYGLFAFNAGSLNVSVAEDTEPGFEYKAIANMTVLRKRGRDRDVDVSWCIYKTDDATSLGNIWDLIFLSETVGSGVIENYDTNDRRPNTGSKSLKFSGNKDSYAIVKSFETVPVKGFSISTWLKPTSNSNGTILAKLTTSSTPFKLVINAKTSPVTSSLEVLTTEGIISVSANLNTTILNGSWHNVIVTVDNETGVDFYYDGEHIPTNSSVRFHEILDNDGDLYLGVSKPNIERYRGVLQDVKIFSKSLQEREVKLIAKPVSDVKPINGYLNYPPSVAMRVVPITTVDNSLTEDEKIFSMILTTSRGGADIDSPRNSRAILTVLKSDNANGLFQFSTSQPLSRTIPESVGNVNVPVVRLLGLSGQVTLQWEITNASGFRATGDFIKPFGSLVFEDGQHEKNLTVEVNDELKPELLERFILRLVSAQSNDGKAESTSTSGASINVKLSMFNITIEENDDPYGLLQFSSSPASGTIVPLNDVFRLDVRESVGVVELYIIRAQGTLGVIECSWRTEAITAAADTDFVPIGGTVTFPDGKTSVPINISVIDNDKEELNKTFGVKLYSPTNGAHVGAGGSAVILILPSDDAFGIVNFTSTSLSKLVHEGQTFTLELQRTGGALGPITITWEVCKHSDDLLTKSGHVVMDTNERSALLSLTVKDDVVPELSESLLLCLTNVTSGRLASLGVISNITVLANDDPHGVFEFDPELIVVHEVNTNVTLNIVRRRGSMGITRVYYTSVSRSVSVNSGTTRRAEENQDYRPINGFVDFQPNQTSATVILAIIDDDKPEDNETVFVNLTRAALISDPVLQPKAVGSPRIGSRRLAQVIILRNDNASGIVRLSSSAVTVEEDTVGSFLNITRSIDRTFGEVTVTFEVVPQSAELDKDYRINSNTVTIRDGQSTAPLPISIVNDNDPEFSERFIVRLLSKGREVLVGSPAECDVTIPENDYPYGLIGFSLSSLHLVVSEPTSGDRVVTLNVIREYGTLEIVRLEWNVTLHGRLATTDVKRTEGKIFIAPGENKTNLDVHILADNIPEMNEVLSVTLKIIEGKAELNPAHHIAYVTINSNDEAHGVVEFEQRTYSVKEQDQNSTAQISIVRKRGTYGALRVYYSTLPSTSPSAAIPYQDYLPVTNGIATIPNGINLSYVEVLVVGDNTPEYAKSFSIVLQSVELVNPVGSSRPRIGAQSQANVTIEDDDNVYGLLKVFAEPNMSRIVVNETEGLAVLLEVHRYGGDTGNIGVTAIISSESTARRSEDFRGINEVSKLSFNQGQRKRELSLIINDDVIPEPDETIIVKLINPTGGAAVAEGTGNNVTIVIQANDVVAGRIGFSRLSRALVVYEGNVSVLTVMRSPPAAGAVSVDWVIVGNNVSNDFNETRGTIRFKEGQNVTYIEIMVLADNTSEIDEQFQVILGNPVTSGISQTGAAKVDDLTGTATITIAASNEPHGVLEFQQSSRRVTVKENKKILELSVARLFGNIGTIRLHFTVLNGSVQHLSSQQRLADPGNDVVVHNTSIIIGNGVSIGIIPINIVDDNLAELDEFFLVNITSVELVNSLSPSFNKKTFTPPRLGRYSISEVMIEANDGPHGILVFSPSRIRVPENITVFNVTVLRSQGTFGEIEVNYFIRKTSTIQENDFSVYGGLVLGGEETLRFSNGQRTQNITVFVYDDTIPEGDESFEVHLKKPTGGAQLGRDSVAYVTILVSDAGNGIFKFDDSSLLVFVDEPGNKHVGSTKASFTVVRENGTIGDVVIGWSIRNQSAAMDFKFPNGTITFKDGERRKSFVVQTVVDTTPEKEERFLIVLSVLSGGGELMSPSRAWLTVTENDAPYGEFGFAVSPNILSVEETVGFAEIKVIRHKGSHGRVTVNYNTTSQTADSSSGSLMRFGIFQSFRTANAQAWYSFAAYGKQYLLLESSNTSSNDDSYIGSSLFQWQGIYTHIAEVKTNNAVQWESFSINGQYYIAVANQGSGNNHEVDSTIYKFYQNGTLEFHQNIPTKTASDVKFFSRSTDGSSYLIFSNMKTNGGNTDIRSQIYRWSSGSFVRHGSGLDCRGASGLALFTVNGRDMLSISSFFDSVNDKYRSNSVVFEWKNRDFKLVQEIPTNGARGVEYFRIGTHDFLLFVNSQSSPSLYKWSGTSFGLHQNVPVSNAKRVKQFTMNEEVFLAVTKLGGGSLLLKWNNSTMDFRWFTNITDSGAVSVQPITLRDPVVHAVSLLAVAMAGVSESRLLQPAMMTAHADFIPRRGQLIFENDMTELSIFVTIFNDSISEPDETFLVSLNNATGGAIVGPDKILKVKILSNGNPYGRIGFAPNSVFVIVNETLRRSVVYLEVLREQGMYGEVIVAWNSTGNATSHHGDSDVMPTSGEIVFEQGETRKTINLTIFPDDIAEVNEVLSVRLTHLKKDGSNIPNKGASINSARNTATVLILANDEPHGVVGWRRTVVLAQESEATNSTVHLILERRQGTFGYIEVSYSTVQARSNSSSNERPAVPYHDFIPVTDKVVMADGVNITNISLDVIHDNNPELNEVFFVNITNVRLLHSYTLPSKTSPRINPSSQTAKIIISENDNKRGELNFNVTHLVDPRTRILKVSENIGILSLQILRSGGLFGKVGFEYRLVPETVNRNDYSPTKGQIIFLPNETSHFLNINITDDDEAEVAERFRVEMTQPIGGAKLGKYREVSVEIRASDQPYGVFEFSGATTYELEEGREVRLIVSRKQGSFREVHVRWNLSVGAFPDVYPANGSVTFENGVTSQVIRLKARDDSIPEGDKIYVCHLVSADNGGVIGSDDRVTLRINANDDGYGVMAINPATSVVFVGEPDLPSYDGQVVMSIVRNAGAYGEILVDWELTSDDLVAARTFNKTRDTVVFGDNIRVRNITLQVKQDSYPEETSNYTFSLTATRDARIDQSASKATVVVVSSDHPYGIIDFDGVSSLDVSEDRGLIKLNVIRNKGHNGKLLVTVNVVTAGATEGRDFQISPKVLIIDDKQDHGSINVTILPEAIPELSESFTVSLGNIQLVTSRPVDYGFRNGLQVDMPPTVGKHGNVTITILENDDPHGVIEFKEAKQIVHEHDKSVSVSIMRSGGVFGAIRVSYTITNITAQYGQDYLAVDGSITFKNGQHMANITIHLLDDNLPEDRESFRVNLVSVDGGAKLGQTKTVEIVIETSDNPDGLFGFVNKTKLVFKNPSATQTLKLGISRIGGARSLVQVKIGVFKIFPSAGGFTEDIILGRNELTFQVSDFGPKLFQLSIMPFVVKQEVEEHFVVSITEVSGNASIDSLTRNVTLVILKHGMPNGLFGFTRESGQTVKEDSGSVILTVERRKGQQGTVQVSWVISGAGGPVNDFMDKAGTLVFLPGDERKQINIVINNDNIPELSEVFTVTLVTASGGGDIDTSLSNATITIRANDNPHGRFRIRSGAQRIEVKGDFSRTLDFTIERIDGKFGDVRVEYSLVYSKNYPKSLNGFITIGNEESVKQRSVVLDEKAFLFPSSYFTLTLTGVVYEGPGESEISPSLAPSGSAENITVPDTAANSIVRFKDGYTTLSVNQDNQVRRVVISRDGLYGSVTVSIDAGFSEKMFPGFTAGQVKPSVSSIIFNGNDREKEFSVQVTPVLTPKQKLIYSVYLSNVATPSNIRGGAEIDEARSTAIIEPGGVVVVATKSQNIVVKENERANIVIYRLFSCLGTIAVNYTTKPVSMAIANKDYVQTSSLVTLKESEYKKEINIDITNDDIPELDETFRVQITAVSGAKARLGSNTSSTITIQDDDNPHGSISFTTDSITVFENITTVDIVISRSGGTYGNVGAQVRTIGGGESWDSAGGVPGTALNRRDQSKIALKDKDYEALHTRVNFMNEVPSPPNGQNQTLQLRIKNDKIPELDEEIFINLSDPSGGAVLAEGKSLLIVTIKGNDLMNGEIGFKTGSLIISEDENPRGEIEVDRTHSLGTAKVEWKAPDSGDNLINSSGVIVFQPNEASVKLVILLKQDNIPELESNFTVELVSLIDTREASIDPARNTVKVTLAPSDDPAGLISFDKDSRNVVIHVSNNTVELSIRRDQGMNGKITVYYKTVMLAETYTDGELVINRAIEGKDYSETKKTLVFDASGKTTGRITIPLTPSTASSTSYPKAFNVTLFKVTGGARLNTQFSTAMVIISRKSVTNQLLRQRSNSLKTPLSDSDTTSILNDILTELVNKQQSLSNTDISILNDILNNVLDDRAQRKTENERQLSDGLSSKFMSIFDNMLDPTREDLRGKTQLTESFVKYTFALIHGQQCPAAAVVKKTGKYAVVEGRRRLHKDINGLILKSSSGKNFFTYPSNIYQAIPSADTLSECGDIHFIEYLTDHWFNKDNVEDILNNRVLSTSVKNESQTNPNQKASLYRIYADGRVIPKKAECLKWRSGSWKNNICSLKDETDDYVECECKHFSNFAVRALSDDRIGYEFYYYIAAFICMISFFLVIVSHHACSIENTFSSKLLTHMFFAGFALHLLVVVAVYVSPDLMNKPKECATLGILIHYFLLAHFCWIFVQCCNLWRILVLNDEHTDRKFILYFMLGWGLPVIFVAIYVILTHALYDWDITEIYADVHKNGDMCFIRNAYGALASVLGPILLFLLGVGVVAAQAYQVTLQWKLYDDIFRGHHNIKEVVHLWIVFTGITMTWLFGGLHLAYGKRWLAIIFAIFEASTGLYVFMVYFVLRNQCRRKYRTEDYLLNASSPSMLNASPIDYFAERPVMYDAQSLQSLTKSDLRFSPPPGNEWDEIDYDGATPKGSRRVVSDHPLAEINPIYDAYHGHQPDETNDHDEEESSQDFNDLIYALKTGETWKENEKESDIDLKEELPTTEKLELRRVSIADTHV